MNYLAVIGYTATIYIVLLVGLRLLGKKTRGQITLTDALFIMLISEGVGDAMHAGDDSLAGALVSALTLIALNKLFEWLLYRFPKFSRFIDGIPAIVVRHGKPDRKEMRRNEVSMEDLEQAGRQHGKGAVSDIKVAILETDGKVSVLDHDKIVTEGMIKGLKDGNK